MFAQLRLRRRARAAAARRVRPGGVRAGARVVACEYSEYLILRPFLFRVGRLVYCVRACLCVCARAAAALRRAYGVRAATVSAPEGADQ